MEEYLPSTHIAYNTSNLFCCVMSSASTAHNLPSSQWMAPLLTEPKGTDQKQLRRRKQKRKSLTGHGCWWYSTMETPAIWPMVVDLWRDLFTVFQYETPPIWPYLLGETKRLPVEAPNAALGVSHAISSKVGYRSPSSSMSHGISWGQRPSNDSTCNIYQIFNKTVWTSGMRCQPKLTTCWHLIMIWS